MLHDAFLLVLTWLLFSLTSLISAPFVITAFGKHLPDKGWGFTRVIGWLLIAVPIWFLAHLGLAINTSIGIWTATLILLSVSAVFFQKNRDQIIEKITEAKKYIITEEILFAFGLIFLSLIRGFQPDINGLEKFMDVGLMNSYLHSPTLPIVDMWLAGYTFNYYTFGHYLGAIATQLIRQPLDISYNLLLAVIMGLLLMQSFSVVALLLGKSVKQMRAIASGIIGSLLVTFGGNSQHLWYWLKNRSFMSYWYPDATRFIPFTIHEFPAYSFIVSDLHAHVWSMVLVLLMLPLLYIWSKLLLRMEKLKLTVDSENPLIWSVAIGALLGILASTSTWDTLIYGLLLTILGITLCIISKFKLFKTLLVSAIIIGLSALILASPWFLTFTSISEGARIVTERSELWRFLTLWLSHIVVTAIAAGLLIKQLLHKQAKNTHVTLFILVIIATAWILLLLPELFYMKDIYPGHPRANTMFKLTFQSFILMNLIFAWLIGSLPVLIKKPLVQKITGALFVVLTFVLLIYPYFGYRDYYNLKFHQYRGLNGLQWLKLENPSDYAGIIWLRQNISGRPVVLEAVGESYTTFARVSTFTSFPTVLGWRVHEWLWRGSFDIPGQRSTEVQAIYEQPFGETAQTKLREYNVEYIFVGDKEREAYPAINEQGLKQLGQIIFSQGTTYIIRVQDSVPLQSRVQ